MRKWFTYAIRSHQIKELESNLTTTYYGNFEIEVKPQLPTSNT